MAKIETTGTTKARNSGNTARWGGRFTRRAADVLLRRAENFRLGLLSAAGWTSALAGAIVASVSMPAYAGPEGGQVVRGDVSISRDGSTTLIRASNRSIINFRSFDIGAAETVRFVQPSAKSSVLNRINSPLPTRIDGNLFANGRVYLVNPAGVMFGAGSYINVGGLYAAAGNISDADFIRGNDHFTGMTGSVVNQGRIESGFTALLGQHVANAGIIVAPAGTVVMGSASEAYIGQRNGTTYVKLEGPGAAPSGGAGVENTGDILAERGRVTIAAGDLYSMAMRIGGTVKAKDIKVQGQGSGTVAIEGTLDASNSAGKGGTVEVTGQRVGLFDATIDASGKTGGGQVNVGGGFQGRGDLRRAEATAVNENSVIDVSATQRGDGGTAVVWSDDVTRVYGEISARGGAAGGDGGLIETSSKNSGEFSPKSIDASAVRGKGGEWLLDPRNVTIAGATAGGAFDGGSPNVFTPTADAATANAATIITSLDGGTSVRVTTSDAAGLTEAGNITVNSAITKTAGGEATLTLQAANDIVLNAGISSTVGELNVVLTANDVLQAGQGVETGANLLLGDVTTTGQTITTNGGDFTATGVNITLGVVNATASTGNITVNATGTLNMGGALTGGAIATTSAGQTDVGGVITSDSVNMHSGTSGTGNLILGGITINTDSLTLRAGDGTGGAGTGAVVDLVTNVPVFNSSIGIASPNTFSVRADGGYNDGSIPEATEFGGGVAGIAISYQIDDGSFELSTPSKVAGADLTITSASTTTIGALIEPASATITTASGVIFTGAGSGIRTDSGIIQINAPVELQGDTILDSTNSGGSAGAAIGITGVVNDQVAGTNDLSLRAGTGNVTIGGAIGNTSPIGQLDVVSAATILFSGAVTANGTGTHTFTGTDLTFSGATLFGGGVTATTSGIITLPAAGFTANGAFAAGSTGTAINVSGNVTTIGGLITFSDPLNLLGAGLTINGGASGITFDDVSDFGAGNHTLIGGETFINAAISGTGTLTFRPTATFNITIGVADAGSYEFTPSEIANLSDGFAGIVIGSAAGLETVTIGGSSTFTDPLTLQSPTGSVFINAPLIGSGDASITIVAANAANSVGLGSSITTAGQAVTISGRTNLTGAASIDTTNGGGSAAGANITFNTSGTIDGANTLTLNAGTGGDISIAGAVGAITPTGLVTVTNADDFLASSTFASAGFTQVAGGNSTIFTGLVSSSAAVDINGSVVTFSGGLTTTAGGVTITNTGLLTHTGAVSSAGAYTQDGAGSSSVAAGITATTGNVSFAAPVTFSATQTVQATAGSIIFLDDASAGGFNLTLRADEIDLGDGAGDTYGGTGTLTLEPATQGATIGVGGGAGTLDLSAAEIGRLTDGWASIVIGRSDSTGAIAVSTVTFTDPTTFRSTGGITQTGTLTGTGNGAFTFQGGATANTITTAGGAVNFTAASDLNNAITTNGGNATFTGAATVSGASVTVNTGTGTISFASTLGISNNTLTLRGDEVDFAGNVSGGGSGSLDIAAGSVGTAVSIGGAAAGGRLDVTAAEVALFTDGIGTLSFGRGDATADLTITAASAFLDPVTFNAGSNAIVVNAALTGTDDASFRFVSNTTLAANISTNDGAVSSTGIRFDGNVTVTANSILTASNPNDPSVIFGDAGGDTVSLGTSTLTVVANSATFNGGADSVSGGAGSILALQPTAVGTSIGIGGGAGTLQVSGTTLDAIASSVGLLRIGTATTGQHAVTYDASTFKTAVEVLAPAGAGSHTVNGTLTSTRSSTGTILIDGPGATTTLNAGIVTNGSAITISDSVILGTNILLDTTDGGNVLTGAAIGITGTVEATSDSTETLTLTAGSGGNVTLGGATGATNRLGGFTITSANNVNAVAIRSTTITQDAGAGTSTFGGQLDTSAAGGIDLTGTAFAFTGGATTTNGGTFTLVNSGTAAFSTGAFGLDGDFAQSGGGGVNFGIGLTTTNDDVSFTDGVTLTAASTIGTGTGDITFSGTLDGGQTLGLTGDDVLFNQAVGGTAALGATTINSTTTTALQTFRAASVGNTSTGAVQFSDDVTATTGAFSSTGTTFVGAGTITTTDQNITVNHTDSVQVTGQIGAGTGAVALTGTTVTQDGGVTAASLTMTGSTSVASNGAVVTSGATTLSGGTVSVTASVDADSFGSTGSTFTSDAAGTITTTGTQTINHTGAVVIGGTQTAGAGAITIDGTSIDQDAAVISSGSYTANSADININAAVTSTGAVDLNGGTVDVGGAVNAASFTSDGSTFTSTGTGTITTTGAQSIDHSGAVMIGGAQAAGAGAIMIDGTSIDQDAAVISSGSYTANSADININAAVTSTGAVDLNGGTVDVGGAVNAASFTSDGSTFTSTGAGTITTTGNQTINHTGAVFIGGTQTAGAGAITIDGTSIDQDAAVISSGSYTANSADININAAVTSTGAVDLNGGTVDVGGAVNAASFTSDGSTYNSTAGVTTSGNQTLTHTGAVVVGGTQTSTAGSISNTGNGVTQNGAATAATTYTVASGAGDVNINAAVDAASFDSTGATFTSNGSGTITTTGNQTINHTGAVVIGGTQTAGAGAITIDGTSIDQDAAVISSGSYTANSADININAAVTSTGAVDLNGGTVDVGGAVNAASFTSDGSTYTSTAGVTTTGNQTINHAGLVTIGGVQTSTAGSISNTGNGVTQNGAATAATTYTVASGAGDVNINAAVDAASFGSTGAAFTSNGSGTITTTGAQTINHTGAVVVGGAQTAGAGAITIDGTTIAQDGDVVSSGSYTANATLVTINAGVTSAGAVDLNGGAVNVNGAVNAASFTSDGTSYTSTAGVTTSGDQTINHTGAVVVGGAQTSTAGAISNTGNGVTQNGAASAATTYTAVAGTGDVTLNAAVMGATGATFSGANFVGDAAGDISTTNAAATLTFTGDVSHNGDISVGTGSIAVRSGTDGTGNIVLGNGEFAGHMLSFIAGDQGGAGSTATFDVTTNAPVFTINASAGNAGSFTLEQDATIDAGADGDAAAPSQLPLASQFTNAFALVAPGTGTDTLYSITSHDGQIVLPIGFGSARVANTDLRLTGSGGIVIGSSIAPASLIVNSALTTGTGITITASDAADTDAGAGITFMDTVLVLGDLTLTADEIDLHGALTAFGAGVNICFQPLSTNATVRVGGATDPSEEVGVLDLTAAELALLQDGFESICFGRTDGTGGIFIDGALNLTDAVIFRGMADLQLCNDIITNGAGITFSMPVVVCSDVTVASTGGGGDAPINFGSTVRADAATNSRMLTVDSGAEATVFSGTVGGASGDATELATLTVTAGGVSPNGITIADSVRTLGAQTYNGRVEATNSLTSTTAGTIRINGDLVLLGNTTIMTAGNVAGDNIIVIGGVSSESGPFSLNLDARNGVAAGGDISVAATGGAEINQVSLLSAEGGALAIGQAVSTGAITLTGSRSITTATMNGTSISMTAPTISSLNLTATSGGITTSGDVVSFGDATSTGDQTHGGTTSITGGAIASSAGAISLTGGTVSTGSLNAATTITAAGTSLAFGDTLSGGDQMYTGATTTNGTSVDAGTADVTFNSPLTLGQDLVVTAGNATFGSTVDSAATAGRTLTVNAGGTSFAGNIGSAADGALGALTTDADGTTTLGSGGGVSTISVTSMGSQTFNDAVILAGDSTHATSAGGVTFGSTLVSDGTNRALVVNTAGANATRFGGAVGGSTDGERLASINTNADGTVRFAGPTVVTSGVQNYGESGAVLEGDTTFTGTGITFAGIISSPTPAAMVVAATGPVSVGGDIGSVGTPMGSVMISGSSIAIQSVTTNGAQSYTGATTLNGNLASLAAGGIEFVDLLTISSGTSSITTAGVAGTDLIRFLSGVTGTATALTTNSGAAPTTFGGAVAGVSTFSATGSRLDTQGVSSTGAQQFNGPTVLTSNATFVASDSGGTITFGSSVDSDGTARSLVATASGETFFAGPVGAGSPLSTFTVNGGGSTRLGNNVSTTGAQTYVDAVILDASSSDQVFTLTGTDIDFQSTVAVDAGDTASLVADGGTAPGNFVRFASGAGSGPGTLRTLTVLDAVTRSNGTITSSNGVSLKGGLQLQGNTTVNGNEGGVFIDNQAGTGVAVTSEQSGGTGFDLVLRSNQPGNIGLPSGSPVTTPFKLGGDIGTSGARVRSVTFVSSSGVARSGNAASIVFGNYDVDGNLVSDQGSGTFNVFLNSGGGSFESPAFNAGAGEIILSTRGLNINTQETAGAGRTTVRMGDIAAIGNLTITAERISIRRRGSRNVAIPPAQSGGGVPGGDYSQGGDLGPAVASGGGMVFSSVIEADGVGNNPIFLLNDNAGFVENIGTFSRFASRSDYLINSSLLRRGPGGGNVVRPIVISSSLGLSTLNVASDIAGAIPRDTEWREVTTQTTVSRALREDLIDLGVEVRDIDADELLLSLAGRNVYLYPRRDGVERAIIPEEKDYKVAVPRVPVASAERVVEFYRDNLKGMRTEISDAINTAYEACVNVTGEEPDGRAFRDFLNRLSAGQLTAAEQDAFNDTDLFDAETKQAAAEAAVASLDYLDKIGEAFVMIDDLGLTPTEAEVVKKRMIDKLYDGSIDGKELFAAVTGEDLAPR